MPDYDPLTISDEELKKLPAAERGAVYKARSAAKAAGGAAPGQPATTPAQSGASGQSATAAGQPPATAPGQPATTSGQSAAPPGQPATTSGQAATTAGQSAVAAGQSTNAAGQSTNAAGQSTAAAGQSAAAEGQSATTGQAATRGQSAAAGAGQSATTPGQSGGTAGQAGAVAPAAAPAARPAPAAPPKPAPPKEPEKPPFAQKVLDAVDGATFQWRHGYAEIKVPRERLLEAARTLKAEGFDYLSFITEVDWQDHLELIYHLFSYDYRAQPLGAIMRCELPREGMPEVASLTPVWPGAEFMEREAFEMMGIAFLGHPDLRRILLPDDFVGFPMRRDYENDWDYITVKQLAEEIYEPLARTNERA